MKYSKMSEKLNQLGVLENLIASMIFFSPNFLFLLPFLKTKLYVFFLYNLVIIFVLVSVISHLKWSSKIE